MHNYLHVCIILYYCIVYNPHCVTILFIIVAAGLTLVEYMVVKIYRLERIVSIKVLSFTRYFICLDAGMNRAGQTETTISLYTMRIFNLVMK